VMQGLNGPRIERILADLLELALSRSTDAVLYVIRAGARNGGPHERIHKQLQTAKAGVLGIVFNEAEVGGLG
jgi:hypothetical protein